MLIDLDSVPGCAVVVAVLNDSSNVAGFGWAKAVQYLPSVDARDMRSWLDANAAGGCVVVTPVERWSMTLGHLPHRTVCVPPREYALFASALDTDTRNPEATDEHSVPRPTPSTASGRWCDHKPPRSAEPRQSPGRAPAQDTPSPR
ncbi:hypothetical protein GCM10023319_76420 [Nocardia iowensis]